jgi:glutaredoxin
VPLSAALSSRSDPDFQSGSRVIILIIVSIMPSNRRFRFTVLLVAIVFIIALYTTSGSRQTRDSAFYTKTSDALGHSKHEGGESNDKDIFQRLRDAEDAAKRAADKKGEEFHGEEVKSVASKAKAAAEANAKVEAEAEAEDDSATQERRPRKILKDGTEHVLMQQDGAAKDHKTGDKKEAKVETAAERKAQDELNFILTRSPVIIFSKSYCPYSKKAKDILLNKYNIDPEPYVVELDEHSIGPELQAEIGRNTGRTTVPNILVNGKSIGGGDDMQALHESGKLEDTIRSLGGKRIKISLKGVKEGRLL